MPSTTFTLNPEHDEVLNRWLRASGWAEARQVTAMSKIAVWSRWLDTQGIDLLDADGDDLTAFLTARKRAGIKPSTRHDDHTFIAKLYAYAARDRRCVELTVNPMVDVVVPKVPTRPTTRAARGAEIEAMEAYCMTLARTTRGRSGGERERALRNAAMISLMFRSGLRSVDVAKLDHASWYQHPDLGWGVQIDNPKNEEPRFALAEARTQGFIVAYLGVRGGEPGPLFRGREAHTADAEGRLKAKAIQTAVKRAATKVGVPVSSHQLRRGFVAEYIDRGGDTATLKVSGGWIDPRMPQRYFEADRAIEVSARRYRELMDSDRPTLAATASDPAPRRASRNPNLRVAR